jgi:hypothetical protein
VRRANQLIGLWAKCLKFMVNRKLHLPKKIVVPEIMLFIFNTIIFVAMVVTALANLVLFPLSFFSIAILLLLVGLLIFAGNIFLEIVLDNLILFYALISFIFGRRYISWEKAES